MKTIEGLAMHVHHNILFEYCYDFNERVRAIKETKPENEQPVRLKLFKMLSKEARADLPEKLIKAAAELEKAYAELDKADAEWKKAYAELEKAYAELDKACAELEKAYAECQKAVAELEKAYAERDKADAECQKAAAELEKAYAEWKKACAEWTEREAWHKKHCGCKEWKNGYISFDKIK